MDTRDSYLAQADRLLRKENFTKEDKSKVDALLAMADQLSGASMALRRAKLAADELEMGKRSRDNAGHPEVEQQFREWLRHGNVDRLSDVGKKSVVGYVGEPRSLNGVSAEMREGERARALAMDLPIEKRGQNTTTTAGGYLVPSSFYGAMVENLKAADPLFSAATPLLTKNGSAISPPILDDTRVSAATIAENAVSIAQDVLLPTWSTAFSSCPTWRSNIVLCSTELANDSFFDLSTFLARVFAKRFARGCGLAFTNTLLGSATSAFTSASNTALTYDEIVNLYAAVDPSYSIVGTWLMNPTTWASIMQLKSSTGGSPMVEPEVDAAGRPLLLGRPVLLSPNMPTLAATQKAVAFGDLSQFYRREVEGSLVLQVFRERYIDAGKFAYEAYWRLDGQLALPPAYGSPATQISPVRFITQKT